MLAVGGETWSRWQWSRDEYVEPLLLMESALSVTCDGGGFGSCALKASVVSRT